MSIPWLAVIGCLLSGFDLLDLTRYLERGLDRFRMRLRYLFRKNLVYLATVFYVAWTGGKWALVLIVALGFASMIEGFSGLPGVAVLARVLFELFTWLSILLAACTVLFVGALLLQLTLRVLNAPKKGTVASIGFILTLIGLYRELYPT